jgi:hypothetical protein
LSPFSELRHITKRRQNQETENNQSKQNRRNKMTKQINQCRRSYLLATIAVFIVLSGFGSVFAQKADNYPKPDFSEMEEYWEIVSYEYDFADRQFRVIAKAKQKVVPIWWNVTWRDSKGITIEKFKIVFSLAAVEGAKIGEPLRAQGYSPFKRQMAQVKTIDVKENPDGGDAKLAN